MLTDALARDAQAHRLARIDQTATEVGEGFPHAADGATERWEVKPDGSWTGGFWVGRFRDAAGRILASLIRAYLTPVGPEDLRPPGMLLHGCDNLHTGEAPHELVWGDYVLLEALARWQGR